MDEGGKLMGESIHQRLTNVLSMVKPQLSLMSLLVLVTVIAMLTAGAANWYLPKRSETAARSRFEFVEA